MKMERLIEKLQLLKEKQKELMNVMSKEKCRDINSVLRAKGYAEGIIELEVKIQTLMDAVAIIG
jgi:hypothetical protein